MNLPVGEKSYQVIFWDGQSRPLDGSYLAIDTETEEIVKGRPLVPALMQVCSEQEAKIHIIAANQIEAYVEALRQSPMQELVFHNASFDLDVLGIARKPWLVDAVETKRITDTGLRFCLHELSKGSFYNKWALDFASKRILDIEIEKDKEIRLGFSPGMELTEKHLIYAAQDVAITAQLREALPQPYPTEHIQLVGAIALYFIGRRGMLVDQAYQQALRDDIAKRIERCAEILAVYGYEKGSDNQNTEVLQTILKNLEARFSRWDGAPVRWPRTPKTGQIKVDDGLWDFVGTAHPFLNAYKQFTHEGKMLENYCNTAYTAVDGRVHPFFSPIMKTARSSASGPNLQNVPREGGYRGVYVAPPGWALLANDYSQLELCCLAQTCWTRYKKSVMREILNSGADIHQWFGDIIMQKAGMKVEEADATTRKRFRQMAKSCNFGYPGGLGITTFKTYAQNSYGVELTHNECFELRQLWLQTFPEMTKHLSPPKDPKGYATDDEEFLYIGATVMGRKRSKATFGAACNYPFQGLAADGAKIALWFLHKEDFRIVNFVHDEVIIELELSDPELQQRIKRVQELMVSGMKIACPDVDIKTESVLMLRWDKKAESVHDSDGNLLVWKKEEKK